MDPEADGGHAHADDDPLHRPAGTELPEVAKSCIEAEAAALQRHTESQTQRGENAQLGIAATDGQDDRRGGGQDKQPGQGLWMRPERGLGKCLSNRLGHGQLPQRWRQCVCLG